MEERKITINKLLVNYKTSGQGKVVLVLHGWGVGSASWTDVIELLAAARFCVVMPDMPGFGKSQVPEGPWQIDDYMRWIEQFVREMNLAKFYLVGHSLGGAFATKFCALHPEMVEKLILCDAAIIRKERLDWRQTYAKKISRLKVFLIKLPFAKGIIPLAQKIIYRLAGNHDYQLASPIMKETFKNMIKTDTLDYARRVAVPTLIIWGDKDQATPVEDAYEINKVIKNSRLEIIAGAGHKLHRTHATELAKIISTFVAK